MSLRLFLFFLVLTSGCKFSNKVDKKSLDVSVDALEEIPVDATEDELINTPPYDFKVYQHLDSLKITDYVAAIKTEEAPISKASIFLYQNENPKIRIAIEKNSVWHTWEIFDATDEHYYADIRLENFDNQGHKELIITSTYGSRLQSTMGNEFYQDTDIWDLDNVRHYFGIQHAYHEDDKGRNGDNTYSKDCKLEIQIQPLSITVSKDKKFADLEVNADCFKNEKYPKSFRLDNNQVIEFSGN